VKAFPFPTWRASGYIWGAHFDENGKGSLRMTAIDASQFSGRPQLPSVMMSIPHGTLPETQRSVSQAVHRHLIRNQRSAWGGSVFSSVKTGMF